MVGKLSAAALSAHVMITTVTSWPSGISLELACETANCIPAVDAVDGLDEKEYTAKPVFSNNSL